MASYSSSWAEQWDHGDQARTSLTTTKSNSRSKAMKNGLEKTKTVAAIGLQKSKVVAVVGYKKAKKGTIAGYHWVKDKYQKRNQKY